MKPSNKTVVAPKTMKTVPPPLYKKKKPLKKKKMKKKKKPQRKGKMIKKREMVLICFQGDVSDSKLQICHRISF
jgi:hypothetical protein